MSNTSRPPFSIAKKIIFILSMLLLVFALGQLVLIGKDYLDGRAEYDDIKNEVVNQEDTEQTPEERIIDFASLKTINSEAVAWLYVPAVGIDYPVMYSGDNQKYLHTTSSGSENTAGAVFLDGRNKSDFSDLSSYIYGHHLMDGSMFTNLLKFQDKAIFESDPYFYIYLPEKIYKYKIFSVHEANALTSDYSIGFDAPEDYAEYLNMSATKTMYATNEVVAVTQPIITLSTCKTYNLKNPERFVVQGKQVDVINY